MPLKYLSRSTVKVKFHRNVNTSRGRHSTYCYHTTSISDQYFFSYYMDTSLDCRSAG